MPKEKKSKRGRSLTSPNKPEPDIAHGGLKKKQKKPDKGSENENRDQTYKPRIPLEQLCSYGSVINNRYEVRDFLGGGSFGMVSVLLFSLCFYQVFNQVEMEQKYT